MAKKPTVAWYAPGPKFQLSDALKKFILDIFLTFVAGGLIALIDAFEAGYITIPPEYIGYTGLILAILHTIYTIVTNYKNGA